METDPTTLEPTRAEDIVVRLSEKLAATGNARMVYGEPVQAHERTIIPVARFGYGLGASSGGREGDKIGGGGGGGGMRAKPAGYIEITNQGTRYVAFSSPRDLLIAGRRPDRSRLFIPTFTSIIDDRPFLGPIAGTNSSWKGGDSLCHCART